MATLTQVLDVLGQNVQNAIYPNGTSSASTAGVDVNVISGWPIRNKIDEVLKAGKALISIFPTNKVKIVTKYERDYQPVSQTPATLTATVTGNTVTIGGTVTMPQAVMINYDGTGYAYSVLGGDTTATIAAALAGLIPGATSLGSVITTNNPYSLTASIATSATAAVSLSQQERVFLIRCWATNETIRDNLFNPIDIAFKTNYRIVLPDGFYGITWPVEAPQPFMDDWEKSLMVIGDLQYKIRYQTTDTQTFTTITGTVQNVQIVNEVT